MTSFLADPALRAVLAALPGARIVGGAVRDSLAGREVADIDLATPMLPAQIIASLAQAGLKSVPTGLDHGTITAVADHRGFEVTTLRRDIDTDGRHAVVEFTDDWLADAARRDFTINAMSMTPDGAVFDYFDGRADLAAGRVRFVGEPGARIAEDYLRILRYFRFLTRYGEADSDQATLAALKAGIPGLARLSGERVWSELKRILAAPDPWPTIRVMHDLGILEAVLPSAIRVQATGFKTRFLPPPPCGEGRGGGENAILRLAALGPRDTTRLRLSNAEAEQLISLHAIEALADDASDAEIRRALADTPPDILAGRAWLASRTPALIARIEAAETPVFPLQGRDLQAIGISPGPEIGAALRHIRAWWLQGGCIAGHAECLAELARSRPR